MVCRLGGTFRTQKWPGHLVDFNFKPWRARSDGEMSMDLLNHGVLEWVFLTSRTRRPEDAIVKSADLTEPPAISGQ